MFGCPECDLLVPVPVLHNGQRALCPRCGYTLLTCKADPFGRAGAWAVAGLMFLAMALSFPFMKINAGGFENSMTLFQTVSYLASYGANTIAVLVFVFVILLPSMMLVSIVVLTTVLRRGIFFDGLLPVTRGLFRLNAWSMVEVFSIGVIVSLVKIAALARVELGISFWAYLAFSMSFLLSFAALDKVTVWSTIDRLRKRQ